MTSSYTIQYHNRDRDVVSDSGSVRGLLSMVGKIRTDLKCPVCNCHYPSDFICHSTTPDRYYIDIWWQGHRYKIRRDRSGYLLDSHPRALRLLERIRSEVDEDEKKFDPTYYSNSGRREYSFTTVSQEWFSRVTQDMSPGTSNRRKYTLSKHILPEFGKFDIREIRAIHIDNFYRTLKSLGYEVSYCNSIMKDLHTILSDAHHLQIIDKIPTFPVLKTIEKPVLWIDYPTQIRILRRIPPQHRPIFRFLFLTGCRVGEARAMMWDCINFKDRVLTIKRTFSISILKETKTGRCRLLPISKKIYKLLKSQSKGVGTGYVFINSLTGTHYGKNGLGELWRKACREVGVEIPLYNGTRHSFFTRKLNEGHRLETLQCIAGHTSLKTTQKYARMLTESLLPVMEDRGRVKVLKINNKKNSEK